MTTATAILGVVPGLQATALLGHNIKFVKQSMNPKKRMSPKKIVKVGVTNLVGISLMKPTASMINALD